MVWQEINLATKNYWFFLSGLNELLGGWAVPVGYSTKDVFRVPNLGNPSPTLDVPYVSAVCCLRSVGVSPSVYVRMYAGVRPNFASLFHFLSRSFLASPFSRLAVRVPCVLSRYGEDLTAWLSSQQESKLRDRCAKFKARTLEKSSLMILDPLHVSL